MANGENRTAVLLDQHPLWLNALERILAHAGVSPVAKATTTTAALAALEEHRPDLFVLDIDMNGCTPDGLTCLRNALARQPSLKAVVVSATDDPERIEAALTGGAVAYVLKRAEPEDLASADPAGVLPLALPRRRRGVHAPAERGGHRSGRPDASGARDPAARLRGQHERAGGEGALGHGADGEIPPGQYLQEARRDEPDAGEPLGARSRPRAIERSGRANRVFPEEVLVGSSSAA